MARIRTIKPGFWSNEDLNELPEATHLLAAALLNYADDDGYFNANPKLVKAECSPLREPSVSIHDSLIHLARIGYLRLGKGSDGRSYGHIINFHEHQHINRKTESKIKKIAIVWESSVSTHAQLTESSRLEGKGREEEGNKDAAPDGAAPEPSIELSPEPEKDLFQRGKEICGKTSGGLIRRVLAAKNGNVALARAAVEQASTKQNPREYLGAIISARNQPADDAFARGDAW